MVPRMSAPTRQTMRRRVGPTPASVVDSAKLSRSLATVQPTPAGTFWLCAITNDTGPLASRPSTIFGALPSTLVKSATRSCVARCTGPGSCALSTMVTAEVIKMGLSCARARGCTPQSRKLSAAKTVRAGKRLCAKRRRDMKGSSSEIFDFVRASNYTKKTLQRRQGQ